MIEPPDNVEPVYHLYVVQVGNREETTRALASHGIGFGIHYPIPLHLQPSLSELGYKAGSLPVTEATAGRVISLPMCAELSQDRIERVCDVLTDVARP